MHYIFIHTMLLTGVSFVTVTLCLHYFVYLIQVSLPLSFPMNCFYQVSTGIVINPIINGTIFVFNVIFPASTLGVYVLYGDLF